MTTAPAEGHIRIETRCARGDARQRTGISNAGARAPRGARNVTISESGKVIGAQLPARAARFNRLTSLRALPPLLRGMLPLPRSVLGLVALGAIWALNPALAKVAMAQGMRPLGVAAIAAACSALTLLAVAWWKRDLPRWSAGHLRHYVAGGFVGLTLANLFAFTGLTRAPAGLFALMVPLSALFSVVFFALAGLERATPRAIAGTLVGMAGVALAMAPGAALPDPALLPWATLMLLTPVCYAAANLLSIKLAVPGASPGAQAAGTVVGAAATAVLVALPLGHLSLPPSAGIAALLVAQGVLTGLGYLIYFALLVGRGGVFTSQVSYLITLAGLGWGYLFFAEVPGWLTVPAAALIFAGVLLVTVPIRRKP